MLPLFFVLLERREQPALASPMAVLAARLLVVASAEVATLEAILFREILPRRQYKTADQPDTASHNWHS